jgi:hypothetical protein
LEEHIVASRIVQGEREAKDVPEKEQSELAEQWVIIKVKAYQPSLSRAQTSAVKICPKCRRKHVGIEEELVAENEQPNHAHS